MVLNLRSNESSVSLLTDSSLFYLVVRLSRWWRSTSIPKIIVPPIPEQNDEELTTINKIQNVHSIIAACPTLHRLYYPPLIFMSSHAQLIPLFVISWLERMFPPCTWITELAELSDGEFIHLDWANSIIESNTVDNTPILMIHHGANGNTRDLPGQTYVGEALKRGWHVCVFNRRGHNKALSKANFNFFGSTSDIRQIIQKYIKDKRPLAPVFMLGNSAGSGCVARYMGDQGLQEGAREGFCSAAVGISPGYNIEKCMGRMNPIYEKALLIGNSYYLHHNRELLQNCPSFTDCLEASDLQSWLDSSWSLAGKSSKEEYYEHTNPMRVVEHISQPCLFINAEDDPLCVIENVEEHAPLFNTVLSRSMVAIAVSKVGGHCCFYEANANPLKFSSWSERVSFEFFDAVLFDIRKNNIPV